jgi:hypothetical protein
LHVCEEQFEAIAQTAHVRVRIPLQLVPLRDDLDRPALQRRRLTGFEAQVEISRVFGVDAESVGRARGISHDVSRQPFFYSKITKVSKGR